MPRDGRKHTSWVSPTFSFEDRVLTFFFCRLYYDQVMSAHGNIVESFTDNYAAANRPSGRVSSKKTRSSHGHLRHSTHTDLVILRVFNMPYPLSSRCEVPMEDPTNRGFCRPLPVDLFPIPVLPEMPRESQSTSTLHWLRM